jgi:hypothetical protein
MGDAVTETEWLVCTDPAPMLGFLRMQRTTSDRKLRLFAVACCRRRWDWLGEKSRHSVDVLEEYLDGRATASELHLAAGGAFEDWLEEWGNHHASNAAYCAVRFRDMTSHDVAFGAAAEIAEAVQCEATISKGISRHGWPPPQLADPAVRQACIKAGDRAKTVEQVAQCHLLREIFHGPRRAVYFRANWGAWNDGMLRRIAKGIYEERQMPQGTLDTARLRVLANALVDAGCDEEELLAHCRSKGPHVKGCWAVDLILGRQ